VARPLTNCSFAGTSARHRRSVRMRGVERSSSRHLESPRSKGAI
jgi:hypothetical protein